MRKVIEYTKNTWEMDGNLIYNYVIAGDPHPNAKLNDKPLLYLLPQSQGDGPFQTQNPIVEGMGHSSIPWYVFGSDTNYIDAQEKYKGTIKNIINKWNEGDVVLYAGELGFNADYSLSWWNNSSGHYVPVPWWVEHDYVKNYLQYLDFNKYKNESNTGSPDRRIIEEYFGYQDPVKFPEINEYSNINLTIYDNSPMGIIFGDMYPEIKRVTPNSNAYYENIISGMTFTKFNYIPIDNIMPDFQTAKTLLKDTKKPYTLTFENI
jgi:hypothetical protein